MRHTEQELIERGLARYHRGRLIPVIQGGSEDGDEPLFPVIPTDFAALSDEDLASFVEATRSGLHEAAENSDEYVDDAFTIEDLKRAGKASLEALKAANAESDRRKAEAAALSDAEAAAAAQAEADAEVAGEQVGEIDLSELAAEAEALGVTEALEVVEVEAGQELVASAVRPIERRPLPPPRRARQPLVQSVATRSLTAAAPNLGYEVGDDVEPTEIARMMEKRRGQFGNIAEGTRGEKIPIARVSWKDRYQGDRVVTKDEQHDMAVIAAATDPGLIRRNFDLRRSAIRQGAPGLVASGGLCAPVTPYYNLQMVSVAERPVRAALPAFNADRGGIRFARPSTLASITTAVGVITAAEDALGGTSATKTCQVVDCPPFEEIDVQILYHCLQFGNLGARTFPERVAQWNNLVLAAHARLCESELLTGIDTASTQVTAASLGLGASATLPSQILAAAEGMRSRHRMDPDAVLRVILPKWVLSLLVSDVYRSQFDRFSMTPDDFVALLRDGGVEPSFHIDGANGRGQVFDVQDAGGLLPFPDEVVWYLYPEGSFLYVDDGVLELGLVRDSVLNRTNDFQIFGEAFENVAFVGVESLAVATPVCDTGIVSGPIPGPADPLACPYVYTVEGDDEDEAEASAPRRRKVAA